MENPIKIVRYSAAVKFERTGNMSDIQCMYGTMEDVKKRANEIAHENGVEVICIV